MLTPGDQAPDFSLPDQNGDLVTLSELKGTPIVLYFYPKVDTPGCTTQACGIRDHRADYAELGATVLGVSPDPVKPIARFADKFDLGFPLLSDEDHSVAESYGVWVEKSMYGRTYMGNERSTFLIDADGKISHIFRKVKPAEHDEQVLAALTAA
ncbi:MAG TPA: thioredoxin-dependent thiol peroxidase [Solirubrobacteraceae bacterium]|nr:thioredoxin-dependent thiol peroxidase [Solirubrobacteraceae bacterium]